MPVIDVTKDPAARTMTVTSEFAAPPERVWRLWEDPRQLERWWGPPAYPATFETLELRDGGQASYFMTGPEGDTPRGWWRIVRADRPNRILIEDGFADADGTPNDDLPVTRMEVVLTAIPAGTRMQMRSTFPSLEAMEQLVAMGMEEGLKEALGQIDALLAA